MIIGCDFGITNTDVVLRKADGSERFFSFASNQVNGEISAIIDLLGNNIDVATINKIYVTGGKSSDLPKKFLKKKKSFMLTKSLQLGMEQEKYTNSKIMH
ncbi:hypothetical protein M9B41_06035 [SAR86 cluster bacterium]|nr:hypothetical protein M9B41_06035 [SAR86 cluster bacterium]